MRDFTRLVVWRKAFALTVDLELLRFLDIALASGKELYSHLLMAREVGTLTPDVYGRLEEQREEIVKMLCGFRRAVRQRSAPTDGSG